MNGSNNVHLVCRFSDRRVWIDDEELLPDESQKVYNHSPDGFNWGYAGSGPAQLALAISLKYLPRDEAILTYQDVKTTLICPLRSGDVDIVLPLGQIIMYIRNRCITGPNPDTPEKEKPELQHTHLYLVITVDDLEAVLEGPFDDENHRDLFAKAWRKENGDGDGIHPLDITVDGNNPPSITIYDYTGGFFEDEE